MFQTYNNNQRKYFIENKKNIFSIMKRNKNLKKAKCDEKISTENFNKKYHEFKRNLNNKLNMGKWFKLTTKYWEYMFR